MSIAWMRLSLLCIAVLLVPGISSGQSVPRAYPENELIDRPAIHISVGHANADLIGTDNRVLQAAVDYVGNLGGGVVEVGPGEYLMRDSLHMRTRVTLRGSGEATVLKKVPSARSLLAADGDFGEEAILVNDPAPFSIGDGVYIATEKVSGFHTVCATILNKKDNYLTLSRPLNADCMMRDRAYAATVFPVISAYHVQEFRLENLTVDGNRQENEGINGCRGAGIFFYQGDGATIQACTVRDYNGDGISFQQSNGVQVLNCHVEQCSGGGIHPGSGSQRPVIRGCTSVNNGANGFYFCWRVRNGIIEENIFQGNGLAGISIGHKDSDNLIRNNKITDNKEGGVRWRNEAEPMAPHRITFENNTVENNGGFGLFIDGNTEGTIVRENTIEGPQDTIGIKVGPKVGDVHIEENAIRAERDVVDERSKAEGH